MAGTTPVVIQFRRDTTENWETNKLTVPAAGEPCLNTDTMRVVYGDGKSTYEDLCRRDEECGPQHNVIDTIRAAGVVLSVQDGAVDIPRATRVVAGLVRGADAENQVSVSKDGTMELASLNVDRLVQTDGDVLILDGGTSKTNGGM